MKKDSKFIGLGYKKTDIKDLDDLTEYVSANKSIQDMIRIKDRIGKAKENLKKAEKYILIANCITYLSTKIQLFYCQLQI